MFLSLYFVLICIFTAHIHGNQTPQVPLTDEGYTCTHPPYKVHVFSTSPLVIYITDFITPEERLHLLDITYVFQVPSHLLIYSSSLHNTLLLAYTSAVRARFPPPWPPPALAIRESTTPAPRSLPVSSAGQLSGASRPALCTSKASMSPENTSSLFSSCPTRRSRHSTTTPTGSLWRLWRPIAVVTAHHLSSRTSRRRA
jgi:hypothetical protein